MTSTSSVLTASSVHRPSPPAIAFAGLLSLALAMGIGRFAYTALLPLMREEGLLTLASAGWLAAANYAGYLAGALWAAASRQADGVRRLYGGLVASAATTLLMGWPWAAGDFGYALQVAVRFAAGLASACVYVYGTGIVLRALVEVRASAWSALHYVGVGVGICLSAVAAQQLVDHAWASAWGWRVLGVFAALAGVFVAGTLGRAAEPAAPAAAGPATAAAASAPVPALGWLAVSYGLAGFGYIVSATFLPTMLRLQSGLADAALTGWLLVGLAAIPASWLWVRLGLRAGAYPALLACTLLQAAGVALPVLVPGRLASYAGAVLLGATFMGIAGLAQWLARVPDPQLTSRRIGFITAFYGVGQIAGPLVAAALARGDDLTLPVLLAAAALLVSALALEVSRRVERLG